MALNESLYVYWARHWNKAGNFKTFTLELNAKRL